MLILWQELDLCYEDKWDCPADSARFLKTEENDRVYMFLAGVNRELDDVKGRILGRKPLPTMREVFSELRREEARRHIMLQKLDPSPSELENSALLSSGTDSNGDKRKKSWCDHCKRSGHTMENCWKLHGKPPHWKKKGGGRAFHASNDVQDHQSSSGELPFTKEQIDTLVKLLQSSNSSIQTPSSCSLAQSGNYLHAA